MASPSYHPYHGGGHARSLPLPLPVPLPLPLPLPLAIPTRTRTRTPSPSPTPKHTQAATREAFRSSPTAAALLAQVPP